MKTKAIGLVGLLSFVILIQDSWGAPLVSVELQNRTGGACQKVSLALNGKVTDLSGNVPNGNSSVSGGWPYPMPSKAIIRWVPEDGKSYSVILNPPKIPKGGDFLNYQFVILPNGRANVAVFTGKFSDNVEKRMKRYNAMTIFGCDGGPNYRVAVQNITDADIRDVDVRFGLYAVNAGTYLSSTGQNYSIAAGLPYPVTKSVSLRWASESHTWSKNIELENILPQDLNEKCIWFTLEREGNVRVQVVDWSDLRAGKHPELCKGSGIK